MNLISLVDLALDTVIMNGRFVNADCLWGNVPILTFQGDNWSNRVTSSFYNSMQIDAKHFIANNYDEYVEKAIVLADKADRNDDS